MGEARHYKPTYHAYIPKGWCNDPNGMIYYNGTNHLYFQHYPYNAAWGTMHWGHFTSKDFIKWELQPVALRPDQDYEVICGCCSGNAVEKDGKLYIIIPSPISRFCEVFMNLSAKTAGPVYVFSKTHSLIRQNKVQ